MGTAHRPTVNIADLAAALNAPALGPNVVRFVPPAPRDEAEPIHPEWVESLELIDQAAEFYRATEQRAVYAEERAEKVATKAMEGLRTAQQRVAEAEANARALEEQAASDLRLAHARITEAEARIAEAEAW